MEALDKKGGRNQLKLLKLAWALIIVAIVMTVGLLILGIIFMTNPILLSYRIESFYVTNAVVLSVENGTAFLKTSDGNIWSCENDSLNTGDVVTVLFRNNNSKMLIDDEIIKTR